MAAEEQSPPTSQLDDLALASEPSTSEVGATGVETDVVTPWEVGSSSAKGVDYDKLISKHADQVMMIR